MQKTVIIIGKGPYLDKYLPIIKKRNQIIACVNEIINFIDRPDYLFINDLDTIANILPDKRNLAKKVIVPTYPHINGHPCSMFDWKFFCYFGISKYKLIIYDLHTSPKPEEGRLNFGEIWSSSETAIAYFLHLGFKSFETYGIGIEYGYSKRITETPPDSENEEWLKTVKSKMINRADEGGAVIKFHI